MLNFSRSLRSTFGIAILAVVPPAFAQDPADPPILAGQAFEQAERLYQARCGACHSLDHNRVGPRHRGVYGAPAGRLSDFRYSRALQELDVIWTEETLDEWLQNPPKFARGTAMGFSLRRGDERETIINYLKSVSVSQAATPDDSNPAPDSTH